MGIHFRVNQFVKNAVMNISTIIMNISILRNLLHILPYSWRELSDACDHQNNKHYQSEIYGTIGHRHHNITHLPLYDKPCSQTCSVCKSVSFSLLSVIAMLLISRRIDIVASISITNSATICFHFPSCISVEWLEINDSLYTKTLIIDSFG